MNLTMVLCSSESRLFNLRLLSSSHIFVRRTHFKILMSFEADEVFLLTSYMACFKTDYGYGTVLVLLEAKLHLLVLQETQTRC